MKRKGLSRKTAETAAQELTDHDAPAAHFDAELGIDPDNLTNPWHAALASAASFLVGAMIPLIFILVSPAAYRVPITFVSVIIALAFTGIVSAKIGGANIVKATVRVVSGGALAMIVTYSIGRFFHVSGI